MSFKASYRGPLAMKVKAAHKKTDLTHGSIEPDTKKSTYC